MQLLHSKDRFPDKFNLFACYFCLLSATSSTLAGMEVLAVVNLLLGLANIIVYGIKP